MTFHQATHGIRYQHHEKRHDVGLPAVEPSAPEERQSTNGAEVRRMRYQTDQSGQYRQSKCKRLETGLSIFDLTIFHSELQYTKNSVRISYLGIRPEGTLRSTLSLMVFLAAATSGQARQTAALRTDLQPQDPKLRAQAVSLLEEAIQTSTPPSWTNVQIDTRFHVVNPAPGEPADGEHILTVGSWWKLRQHEWIYGSNHLVMVRNGDLTYWRVSEGQKPSFADMIENTTPIDLVRFNREDVIRSIADRADGTQCIDFEAVFGDREMPGEICIDPEHHWMVSKSVGDTLTLNSRFVPFHQAFVPEHVEIWVGGAQQFVLEQSVTPRADFPADFFAVPENANIKMGSSACAEFRPAHPLNAPQPTPLSSAPTVTDVRLQGLVGSNGRVSLLRAVDNLHPDLNQQAIPIVSQWTFVPASCDGKSTGWYTTFVVEFRGR